MLENIPWYLTLVFFVSVIFTWIMFYLACGKNKHFVYISLFWIGLSGSLALTGFFANTTTVPPRFPLVVAPMFLLIIVLFLTNKGRNFIDGLNLKTLTLLSVVRIPIEFCLLWLFLQNHIPESMTFEGRNFDILAGLSAPVVAYWYFVKNKLSKKVLLTWNIISLLLLLNVVVTAILSLPSPFQQMAFDQPNTGVLYFPFIWLPAFIVPVVMFTHFVAIRRLRN